MTKDNTSKFSYLGEDQVWQVLDWLRGLKENAISSRVRWLAAEHVVERLRECIPSKSWIAYQPFLSFDAID